MKVLILLNGPSGWQTGIEDGFSHLRSINRISELKQFYFEDYARHHGAARTLQYAIEMAESFLPELIVIFHIGSLPLSDDFPAKLKSIASKPILVYDEGDMYGSWAKPMTQSMKIIMRHSDVVSLRGLGVFAEKVSKLCNNVIYTPHHADIARYDREPHILTERAHKITLIGNNMKPRISGLIRRLPGSRDREKFADFLTKSFTGEFSLFGNGWEGSPCNRGPVDFQKQLEIYRNTWVTVAFEHYPQIPYYFSNRLPLAMLAGSLYVCHYHEGYEHIFGGSDFIFFYNTVKESRDVIDYVLSLSQEDRLERSKRAREFALKHYHPDPHWTNFYDNVLSKIVNK
jgi:hypothetical protein